MKKFRSCLHVLVLTNNSEMDVTTPSRSNVHGNFDAEITDITIFHVTFSGKRLGEDWSFFLKKILLIILHYILVF